MTANRSFALTLLQLRIKPSWSVCSYKDKEVQRDSKMLPYKVVDKNGKPNVEVQVGGETKVRVWPLSCRTGH